MFSQDNSIHPLGLGMANLPNPYALQESGLEPLTQTSGLQSLAQKSKLSQIQEPGLSAKRSVGYIYKKFKKFDKSRGSKRQNIKKNLARVAEFRKLVASA